MSPDTNPGRNIPSNRDSYGQSPQDREAAKRARRAASKAQRQVTQTRAFWVRRIAPVAVVATTAIAGAGGSCIYQARRQNEKAKYQAALQRRALTPSASRTTPQNGEARPVETTILEYGGAHYAKNYVLVNLVEGLELELNVENMDRLYRDPRVRIRVQERERDGVTPVNLLFIAPLGGVSNQQDIINHMLLVDPKIPEIKEEYQKLFPSGNAQYKNSSIPFYSTIKSAAINTTPSPAQAQRLGVKLSEDTIRASIQGSTVANESPLFALSGDETRMVIEYQPIRVLGVQSRTILDALNR